MLDHDMDISRLMIYAQGVDEEKLKERFLEKNRFRTDDLNSPQGRFSK